MSEAPLSLCDVRFGYGEGAWTLRLPSLHLGAERVTCIVGPNGSGKSTLLRVAGGMLTPESGHVTLAGKRLGKLSRRAIARRLGFLPQETPPLFDYTVEVVAAMGRYAYTRGIGALADEDRRAVAGALEAVGMAGLRERPLSHLSGGERRRALIASVLAQSPQLLLLDEPTAALDLHHAAALMRRLSSFGSGGPAVVIVTHDLNLAALFGERLIMLVDGRVFADGMPRDVVAPDVLRQVYGEDVLVERHPETGGPMVVARGVVSSAATGAPLAGTVKSLMKTNED